MTAMLRGRGRRRGMPFPQPLDPLGAPPEREPRARRADAREVPPAEPIGHPREDLAPGHDLAGLESEPPGHVLVLGAHVGFVVGFAEGAAPGAPRTLPHPSPGGGWGRRRRACPGSCGPPRGWKHRARASRAPRSSGRRRPRRSPSPGSRGDTGDCGPGGESEEARGHPRRSSASWREGRIPRCCAPRRTGVTTPGYRRGDDPGGGGGRPREVALGSRVTSMRAGGPGLARCVY